MDTVSSAEVYAHLRESSVTLCRESVGMPTEAQLQAVWFDSALRPVDLALPDGTPLTVLEPGVWNRVDGPDFHDALLSIGGILRRGDVELHLRPSDWDAHGHATDPAYANLILHVVWEATPLAKGLPVKLPQLVLRPFVEQNGPYSFDAIDLSHYPYQTLSDNTRPCFLNLTENPGATDRLLVSAGYFRLQTKSKVFADAVRAGDAFQAFYEALLTTMGYRRNTLPFHQLAHEISFASIKPFPSLQRFAILAGVAGLLSPEGQSPLWNLWWQSGIQPSLTAYAWDFRTLRPQNHPFRRLAGAVGIVHSIAKLLELPLDKLPDALVDASTLLCEPLKLRSGAPIGKTRANAIVTNLFIPYRLALGSLELDQLHALPSEDVSAPMREVWHRLTGESPNSLPREGLRQQGLLQIHADFCHNPRLVCATCPLAKK
ncbi:MAG: DUF2851 family protein [Kiritimatiellia bacterium]